MEHTVVVFNKWVLPDQGRKRSLRDEYQTIFEREYGVSRVPCYFVDSNFNRRMLRDNENGTQSVRHLHPTIQARTSNELDHLVAFLVGKESACDVRGIEARETELGALMRQIEELKARLVSEQLENDRRLAQQLAIDDCIEMCRQHGLSPDRCKDPAFNPNLG